MPSALFSGLVGWSGFGLEGVILVLQAQKNTRAKVDNNAFVFEH